MIGLVFWDQALAASTRGPPRRCLRWCGASSTLPRQDAGLEGMREYAFRHQILHQVTYDTLLKRTRRELHAQVAQRGWPG